MIDKIKSFLKLAAILMVTHSFAQTTEIKNTKTEEYFHISGTKYALIAPDESFIQSTEFTGLINKDLEVGVNITELPLPYDNMLGMLTKDLPPKNGELLLNEDFVMNGFKAKLIKTSTLQSHYSDSFERVPDLEKTVMWVLVYGNETFSLTVVGTYKSSLDEQMSDKMKKSILSFLYLENEKVNPLDQLNYSFEVTTPNLKFATILMQTGVAYTADGKFPSEAGNTIGYIVMVIPYDVEESEREQSALKSFKKRGKDITLEQTNKVTLSGLNGYELIGYELNEKKEKSLKYETTLYDTDKRYMIVGTCKQDLEKNLKEFQKITQSFKLKK